MTSSPSSTNRRVHAVTAERWEVVRYDRAGKWYVEYPDHRLPITIGDAALFATARGAEAFLGRPGGSRFDSLVGRKRLHA